MEISANSELNILIVGQGYAGSQLAWMLINKGIQVSIVDSCPEFSSTKVAAGIMLPVTGRRLAKTHLADRILPFARQTYRDIELSTGHSFFVEKQVLQLFSSISNLNEWYARSSEIEMREYCGSILPREQVHTSVTNEFGGILLNQSGYVEPIGFLNCIRELISEKGVFHEASFHFEDLKFFEKGASWNGTNYTHVIFCEGYHALKNPFFNYLPFKPAKGEILDFISEELSDDYIISNGIYILPMGNSRFRTGATYVWDDLSEQVTAEGFAFLTENLKKSINCKFEITAHKAGIRPAIRDRRPVIGFHPAYPRLGIFNGLGTKGAMLGPYYANQMAGLIVNEKPTDRDVDIRRFESLYPGN